LSRDVEIQKIVDNEAKENSDFIPSDGFSLSIEFNGRRILFDTGDSGFVFTHNLKLLEIDVDSFDTLILSHGHWDHTLGLEDLLNLRKTKEKLKVIAHPHALHKRKVKFPLSLIARIKYRLTNYGFPKLSSKNLEKLEFELIKEPYEVAPFLKTTGEIRNRKEREFLPTRLKRQEGKKYVEDKILDDLSIVLKTENGLAVICGCGHAGILNICERAKELFPGEKIIVILGGTHLVAAKNEQELEHIANKLELEYDKPQLYLSHCTGKRAINFLRRKFGEEIVHSFKIGEKLTFEC